MPYVTKKVLSQYLRTGCQKQLRLDLSPNNQQYRPERRAQGMPDPQPPRPGLEQIAQAGEQWQQAKLTDLANTFGPGAIIGQQSTTGVGAPTYATQSLAAALPQAAVDRFLVEAEFEVTATFEHALGIAGHRTALCLSYADVRPDIIQVLPARHFDTHVAPDGAVAALPPTDTRLQLRIVDIKLTAEPSPGYYAEVAYYTMVLAAWLIEHGRDQDFVVVPNGAIWPGSHDAAELVKLCAELQRQNVTPTPHQLRDALEHDLEAVPFIAFASRVRRFFQDDVPAVLSQPWQSLPWHVDNRCKGCEYLGAPWINAQGQPTALPDHCMPAALNTDHLSRVAFISRGAAAALRNQGVMVVADLARRTPRDPVFEGHQALRTARTVIAGRAASLQTQQPVIPPSSGTSAVLPRWADLHIYLSVHFDLSSAITFALGVEGFWLQPLPFGAATAGRQNQRWPARVFVVDQKDLNAERRELLGFLDHINDILTTAHSRARETTVQFYLWDNLQYEHLKRIIGRHLPAILSNQTLQRLAWLIPPEQVLPNPAQETRMSPLTIVREVVRSVLAAPIAHYYTLLDTARIYHHSGLPAAVAQFNVHPLFEDILGDQIPSERAHDIWSRATGRRYWATEIQVLEETVKKHLSALSTVTQRLEDDLRGQLGRSAPPIQIGPPVRQDRISADGQLWYAFAKLNAALEELETHQIRAMPPHERESRFHSALLQQRLTGAAEQTALTQLGFQSAPGRRVYELSTKSREVKLREGDFGVALAPWVQAGFLDSGFLRVAQGTPLQPTAGPDMRARMADVTQVTVAGIDRDAGLIAVDTNCRWPPTILDELEQYGCANLSTDVMLDPVYHDYFTAKLREALRAIGNPPIARTSPLVLRATGQMTGRGARQTGHTPAADVLWDATSMAATPVVRQTQQVRATVAAAGYTLTATQWAAWGQALSRRLSLLWGPPGTGKSNTARAIMLGAVAEAVAQGRPLRLLVCASTYTAMDNVLLPLYDTIVHHLPGTPIDVYRLRSYLQPLARTVPPNIDVDVNKRNPSARLHSVRQRLLGGTGVTVVGATPEQVHNLIVAGGGAAQKELFDYILIDESSQMDVAHAILALCALANGGSVVLTGDPKQLPPIHTAVAPLGLDGMVGSIYSFCEDLHHVQPIMLDVNYRSNKTLVDFPRTTQVYGGTLSSHSPDLRLNLLSTAPAQPWPPTLYQTPEWDVLLDPAHPAACFVYPEGTSSQWNLFEAQAVTAMIVRLFGRMANQLNYERDAAGAIIPSSNVPYSPAEFWEKAIGIVTPHRAQEGLIVGMLQCVFTGTGATLAQIRDAVDTVERFQGQQRDVIIASFALGDPDAIAEEDEFLLSLRRFNVMASRARAKLIILVSRDVVDHLSHDIDVLRGSELLKQYVELFCCQYRAMTLGYVDLNGTTQQIDGIYRFH